MIPFGDTGLTVPRLCVGTGSSGNGFESMQARQPGYADLLVKAFQHGLTFWDTSLQYGTHAPVAKARSRVPGPVVISTKTHAREPKAVLADFERCRRELGQVDLFLLHEVDDVAELDTGALEALQGKAVIGVSTHSIEVLERAVVHPLVQAVFTNYNLANEHMDASMRDYEAALRTAFQGGKGVYVHKTLNEGKLAHRYREALEFNLSRDFIHSVSIGIVRDQDLEQLLSFMNLHVGKHQFTSRS